MPVRVGGAAHLQHDCFRTRREEEEEEEEAELFRMTRQKSALREQMSSGPGKHGG